MFYFWVNGYLIRIFKVEYKLFGADYKNRPRTEIMEKSVSLAPSPGIPINL